MSTELQPGRVDPLTNMLTLAASMVEKGTDPIALKQTLDLVEQFRKARAAEAFAFDMAECQAKMPATLRTEVNNFTNSRYAPFEEINEKCKPTWTEHGFSLFFSEEQCPTPGLVRIILDVTHRGGHSKRSYIDLPIDGEGAKGGRSAMSALQGKVSSVAGYGRRALVKLAFGIAEKYEDDDGHAGTELVTEAEAAQIQQLLVDIGYAGNAQKMERFFGWLKQSCGAASVKETPRSALPVVLDNLQRAKARAKNGNGQKPTEAPKPEPVYAPDPYHDQATPEYQESGPDPMDQ